MWVNYNSYVRIDDMAAHWDQGIYSSMLLQANHQSWYITPSIQVDTFAEYLHFKMASEAYLVKCDIRALNQVFHKAIRQVIILNEKIVDNKCRYGRVTKADRRSMRYTMRLRLAAFEGTRNMYYEYAAIKCQQIEELQDKLRSVSGEEYNFADEPSNFAEDCTN